MEGYQTQVIEHEPTRLALDALSLALAPARLEVIQDCSFTPIIGLNAIQRVYAYESNVANVLRALDKEDRDEGQTMMDVQDDLQSNTKGSSQPLKIAQKFSLQNENITQTGESTPPVKSESTNPTLNFSSAQTPPYPPLFNSAPISPRHHRTIHRATTGSFMEFMCTDHGALYAIGERLSVYINARDVRKTSLTANLWPVEVIVQPMDLNEGGKENLVLANRLVERWCRRAREGVWREIVGRLADDVQGGRLFEH
ncbi:hypothetical protein BGZ60DRAFT_535505 [Tricladium varicosporioides]|nr:hypothetical protein BGZ60DRAFT_535505 [Hymenoscyphus varicosporioides]